MTPLPPRKSGRFLEALYTYYHQATDDERKMLDALMEKYALDPKPVKPWDLGTFRAVRGSDPRWDGSANPYDLHIEVSDDRFPAIRTPRDFIFVAVTLMSIEHQKHLGHSRAVGVRGPLLYLLLRQAGKSPEEAYAL